MSKQKRAPLCLIAVLVISMSAVAGFCLSSIKAIEQIVFNPFIYIVAGGGLVILLFCLLSIGALIGTVYGGYLLLIDRLEPLRGNQ